MQRAQPSSLVKYQDAKGGASVQRKRVPEMGRTVADNDVQGEPAPESARGRVALTHTVRTILKKKLLPFSIFLTKFCEHLGGTHARFSYLLLVNLIMLSL